ncbi:tyrosine-type recombinase/integrase [Parvicella tangerina]|uniref:Tyrosine recombinase XerC n=1 Tax=Parvicella tangerina TaxID=2829795 RepID=A0A916JM76_9FLAO|nr:tyrosine-type recombinase/integrase [Parvicella tangerina]CAG5081301.1 Tyrosine recombinase XerC [Parvicella tangerina]
MSTFKEYLQRQGKSKSTVTHYSTYILDFITWLDKDNTEPEQATAKEVLSYLNHLQQKGISNKTKAIRLNTINHFFDYQLDKGIRADQPTRQLKIRGANTQKLTPILKREQLENIYTTYEVPTAKDPRNNRNWFTTYRLSKQRNKTILSLLVNQGLTTAEITKIEVNDLKLREGTIYIAGSRKSNERTLDLKPNQIMDLMEYTLQLRQSLLSYQKDREDKRLFLPTPVVGRKTAGGSLNIFKRLTEEIKEQHPQFINLRQIRTSLITHWLKLHNLRKVQYMAGHRYVSTTERYLINHTEDLQKEVDQFHPF